MRGIYEQQWQESMAGAEVQPSAALWVNIAGNLDEKRGRHNWVTLLMIAATVTVAFAFPLTLGITELEGDKNIQKYISQLNDISGKETADNNLRVPDIVESPADKNLSANHNDNGVSLIADNKSGNLIIDKSLEKDAVINGNDEANSKQIAHTQIIEVSSSTTKKYDLSVVDLGVSLKLASIDNHYLLPFYLPSTDAQARSLLASLNMGTGSLSASNSLGGFGAQMDANFSEIKLGNTDGPADYRIEEPGSTYYFAAGIEMPFGKRWSLLAGLGYMGQKASGTSNLALDTDNGIQPLAAYDPIVPGTIFLSESYNYTVINSYINVPVTVKYPFVNRKIKFRGGIGISTDFMISHTLNSDAYGKASYNPASMDYHTVVLAGLINLDLSYSLNSQYAVALETGLRRGLTAIDTNKQYYPSSFTIGLVLFYKIR